MTTAFLVVIAFLTGVFLGYRHGRSEGHRDGVNYLRRRAMAARGGGCPILYLASVPRSLLNARLRTRA